MNALKDKILNVYGHGCVVTTTFKASKDDNPARDSYSDRLDYC